MSDEHDAQLAAAAASAVNTCLRDSSLELGDVDAIVAAPARSQYRATLATHLGIPATSFSLLRPAQASPQAPRCTGVLPRQP